MKNILITFLLIFITNINTFASDVPKVNCNGLPWCNDYSDDVVIKAATNITATTIKFVAVFAVIALMIAWIMYMLSEWQEEKTKKAKNWIIWSLVWVILSTSAYYIVWMIDNIKIT